jgi:hypothetical protein
VLSEARYSGAMNIENEDQFYYPAMEQGNFTEQYKRGFRVAHEFLKTLVPPLKALRDSPPGANTVSDTIPTQDLWSTAVRLWVGPREC